MCRKRKGFLIAKHQRREEKTMNLRLLSECAAHNKSLFLQRDKVHEEVVSTP